MRPAPWQWLTYVFLLRVHRSLAPTPVEHTYQDMLALWLSFFDQTQWNGSRLPNNARPAFFEALYNGVMAAIIRLTENLNLTVRQAVAAPDAPPAVAVPSVAVSSAQLEAERPKDFQIFINLVEFVQQLLPALPSRRFRPWVRCPLSFSVSRGSWPALNIPGGHPCKSAGAAHRCTRTAVTSSSRVPYIRWSAASTSCLR